VQQRDHAGVRFPPPLVFVVALLGASIADRVSPWPLTGVPGMPLRIAAALLIIAAALLATSAVLAFRRAHTTVLPALRPTTAIVERGPYRFSRNPMYLSMAIMHVGIALVMNSTYALFALPVVIAVIDVFVIRREERYLSAKFGSPTTRTAGGFDVGSSRPSTRLSASPRNYSRLSIDEPQSAIALP
jgi:protein-S-isoprenylcysteine O-methyltransferase Ste14